MNDKSKMEILQNLIPRKMTDDSERFVDVSDWYIYKEKVWKFSYYKNLEEKLSNIIH